MPSGIQRSRAKGVAARQCDTCPFRGASEETKRSCAGIPADDWPCHTEDLTFNNWVQCRGHWRAQRKYPNEPHPGAGADDVLLELANA